MKRVLVLFVLASCRGTTTPRTDIKAPQPVEPAPADAMLDAEAPTVTIGLALTVTPADAEVTVDDRPYGPASALVTPIALEPGLHTLIVSLAGYRPYRAEFSITDKIETFSIKLDRKR